MYSRSKAIDCSPLLMVQQHRKFWHTYFRKYFTNFDCITRQQTKTDAQSHKVMTFSQTLCRVRSNRVHLLWFENIRISPHISSWKKASNWMATWTFVSFDLIKTEERKRNEHKLLIEHLSSVISLTCAMHIAERDKRSPSWFSFHWKLEVGFFLSFGFYFAMTHSFFSAISNANFINAQKKTRVHNVRTMHSYAAVETTIQSSSINLRVYRFFYCAHFQQNTHYYIYFNGLSLHFRLLLSF